MATLEDLRKEASELKIKNYSKYTKEEIVRVIEKAKRAQVIRERLVDLYKGFELETLKKLLNACKEHRGIVESGDIERDLVEGTTSLLVYLSAAEVDEFIKEEENDLLILGGKRKNLSSKRYNENTKIGQTPKGKQSLLIYEEFKVRLEAGEIPFVTDFAKEMGVTYRNAHRVILFYFGEENLRIKTKK